MDIKFLLYVTKNDRQQIFCYIIMKKKMKNFICDFVCFDFKLLRSALTMNLKGAKTCTFSNLVAPCQTRAKSFLNEEKNVLAPRL